MLWDIFLFGLQILKKIFKNEEGKVTIRNLIEIPFFSGVTLYADWDRKPVIFLEKQKVMDLDLELFFCWEKKFSAVGNHTKA